VRLATRDTTSDKAKQLKEDVSGTEIVNFQAAAKETELAV
jgi:hypothetical protein